MQEVKPIDWTKYEKDVDPELLADFKKSFEGEFLVCCAGTMPSLMLDENGICHTWLFMHVQL